MYKKKVTLNGVNFVMNKALSSFLLCICNCMCRLMLILCGDFLFVEQSIVLHFYCNDGTVSLHFSGCQLLAQSLPNFFSSHTTQNPP